MSKDDITTHLSRLAKILTSIKAPHPVVTPQPTSPDNVIPFEPAPDLDECLFFCNKCRSAVFLITQAYNVKCAECCQTIANINPTDEINQ